ncbi:MAG: helix-hairpin-helix domain-containing protein [Eubacterium sp.]
MANAKLICKYFNNDIEKITHATAEELVKIDGIGDKMAVKFVEYFSDKENIKKFNNLLNELTIIKEENNEEQNMAAGLNFLWLQEVWKGCQSLISKIILKKRYGKILGSVTSKTNYLINGSLLSNSSQKQKPGAGYRNHINEENSF